jgi:hypothetical protein
VLAYVCTYTTQGGLLSAHDFCRNSILHVNVCTYVEYSTCEGRDVAHLYSHSYDVFMYLLVCSIYVQSVKKVLKKTGL